MFWALKIKASTGRYIANFINDNNEGLFICHNGSDNAFYGAGANTLVLAADFTNTGTYRNLAFSTNNSTVMTLTTSGNIGIGTVTPAYKLDVSGTIRANEVKVDLTGTCPPDFVFKNDYKLMDLKTLEKFVNTNQHLPEIASEKEMIENGVNLKDMQMKLLQKIEELTMYTIEQNKKLEKQNEKIQSLEEKIEKLASASK